MSLETVETKAPESGESTPSGLLYVDRHNWRETFSFFAKLKAPNIMFYADEFLDWDGAAYRKIDDNTVAAMCRDFLDCAVCKRPDKNDPRGWRTERFDPTRQDDLELVTAIKRYRNHAN